MIKYDDQDRDDLLIITKGEYREILKGHFEEIARTRRDTLLEVAGELRVSALLNENSFWVEYDHIIRGKYMAIARDLNEKANRLVLMALPHLAECEVWMRECRRACRREK